MTAQDSTLCKCGHKKFIHTDSGEECLGFDPEVTAHEQCKCKGFSLKEDFLTDEDIEAERQRIYSEPVVSPAPQCTCGIILGKNDASQDLHIENCHFIPCPLHLKNDNPKVVTVSPAPSKPENSRLVNDGDCYDAGIPEGRIFELLNYLVLQDTKSFYAGVVSKDAKEFWQGEAGSKPKVSLEQIAKLVYGCPPKYEGCGRPAGTVCCECKAAAILKLIEEGVGAEAQIVKLCQQFAKLRAIVEGA